MKIILESLTLTNFRGVRSLRIDFDTETTVFGDNRTGKTTVYNAFLWLLFGKDNQDRKDFEIKTLGPDNQPYHRLDHEVSATLIIHGATTFLKRNYKEKWVKKKGNIEPEFTGHETTLFWNDVPYKLEDFQTKVNSILKENVFKMITSTGYFNSMKWQDRRSILLELAGNIKDFELMQSLNEKQNGKYDDLVKAMGGTKTLDEYKRELANKKKKIRDELDHMPARIQEANHSLPEEKDYTSISGEIEHLHSELLAIDDHLMDKTSAEKSRQSEMMARIKKVGDLKVSLSGIEFHIKNAVKDKRQSREWAITELRRELQKLSEDFTRNTSDNITEKNRKKQYENEKADLTAKWHSVNSEQLVFDDREFACPTCKRAYEETNIEAKKSELTKNFNANKSRRLSEISEKGKSIASLIRSLEVKIENYNARAIELQGLMDKKNSEINSLSELHQRLSANEDSAIQKDITENLQHQAITAEILTLQDEINSPNQADENKDALMQQKRALTSKISELNNELSSKGMREKVIARIDELSAGESKMANELADLEKIEFSIYEFTRAKMDEMEARINNRFRMVRFKMFREQVNGGQEECCETLIDGIPYAVANTASQINAGLDIINVMSDHFEIHAPVFVDNRESVVELIPSSSQIINLIVVKGALLSVNKIHYRKDFKPAKAEAEA